MTHEEIRNKVNNLNAKSKELNSIRQQNIGRKEALMKQFNETITEYNKKYGTNLTADTIESELQNIESALQEEISLVERTISAIEAGNYSEAKALTEGVVTEDTSVTTPVESVSEPVATQVEPSIAPTPVASTPLESATPPVIASPVNTVPVAPTPVSPNSGDFLDGIQPSVSTTVPEGSIFSQSFETAQPTSPASPEAPVSPIAPPSFASLVAGSDFQPN